MKETAYGTGKTSSDAGRPFAVTAAVAAVAAAAAAAAVEVVVIEYALVVDADNTGELVVVGPAPEPAPIGPVTPMIPRGEGLAATVGVVRCGKR